MAADRGQTSNSKTAKPAHATDFDVIGATSQSCKVLRGIRNVDDPQESGRSLL